MTPVDSQRSGQPELPSSDDRQGTHPTSPPSYPEAWEGTFMSLPRAQVLPFRGKIECTGTVATRDALSDPLTCTPLLLPYQKLWLTCLAVSHHDELACQNLRKRRQKSQLFLVRQVINSPIRKPQNRNKARVCKDLQLTDSRTNTLTHHVWTHSSARWNARQQPTDVYLHVRFSKTVEPRHIFNTIITSSVNRICNNMCLWVCWMRAHVFLTAKGVVNWLCTLIVLGDTPGLQPFTHSWQT